MSSITIIGAGIVGLATAFKLLEKNPDLKITILEKENFPAAHQTGHNSGVIHSGIYYKPGNLKALNCRNGYKALLNFCDEHQIKYDICGKVIVASNQNEIPYLQEVFNRGTANGLENLKFLNADELKEIEPYVSGVKGIFVPQTGIIDFKEVAKKYVEIIRKYDARIIFGKEVKNLKNNKNEVIVETQTNSYSSDFLISCAGLHSDRIAKMTHPDLPIRIIPFRGEYYSIKKEKSYLVNNLIYPVPDPAFPFLGVHFTRMIGGEREAGPNAVLAFAREGYSNFSFNAEDTWEIFTWYGFLKVMSKYWKTGMGEFYRSFSKKAFTKALQKLVPEISENDLVQGNSGVRAQACHRNGKLIDDFYFVEDENIIHVCNAPSPAATASLSIGNHIANKVLERI